ncbi:MAG: acetylxylan esterase [Acidobacteriota bacterium]
MTLRIRISRRGVFSLALIAALWGPVPARSPLTAALQEGRATARPPASSLARPTSAPKPTDANGFLQRWLLLEPVRVPGQLTQAAVRAAVEKDFPVSAAPLPRAGDTLKLGDTARAWHAVDTVNYNVNLYHFAYALNQPTTNVLFWAITIVNAPRDMSNLRLAIGSNAASVWWVNGQEATALYNDRQAVIDDGVSKRLTLHKGANVIRVAIVNAGGATDFCARFLDENDRPVRTLTSTLTGQ